MVKMDDDKMETRLGKSEDSNGQIPTALTGLAQL